MADQNPTAVTLDHDVLLGSPVGERREPDTFQPADFQLDQGGSDGKDWVLTCSGNWNIGGINQVDVALDELDLSQCASLKIDSTRAVSFDTAGAWMIERLRLEAAKRDVRFSHHDADKRRAQLVEVIEQKKGDGEVEESRSLGPFTGAIDGLGRSTMAAAQDIVTACYLVGASIRGPQMKAGRRGGIRLKSIIHHKINPNNLDPYKISTLGNGKLELVRFVVVVVVSFL